MSIYFFETTPALGGTAVTLDLTSSYEARAGVRRGSADPPLDWLVSHVTDGKAPGEWTSGVAADAKTIAEWLGSVRRPSTSALEISSSVLIAQLDALAPFERLSSRLRDTTVANELTLRVSLDGAARLEWPVAAFLDGMPLAEWQALVAPVDATPPLETGFPATQPTLRYADRVLEQVAAPLGNNPFAVSLVPQWQSSGPGAGFQTFANMPGIVLGDRVFITARDSNGNAEISMATWSTGTLTRGAPLASSNGGAPCNFIGPVTVICDVPALYFNRQVSQKQVATAGNSQGTATPLTAIDNIVTTVTPAANDLIVDAGFDKQTVVNACGTGLAADVWPPLGHRFDSFAVNASASVPDGNMATFFYQGAGQWNVR